MSISDETLRSRLKTIADIRQRRGDLVYGILNEAADAIERLMDECKTKSDTISRLSRRPIRRYGVSS